MTNSEINVTKIHTVILIDNRSLPEKAEFNPNLPHNELIFVLDGKATSNSATNRFRKNLIMFDFYQKEIIANIRSKGLPRAVV